MWICIIQAVTPKKQKCSSNKGEILPERGESWGIAPTDEPSSSAITKKEGRNDHRKTSQRDQHLLDQKRLFSAENVYRLHDPRG